MQTSSCCHISKQLTNTGKNNSTWFSVFTHDTTSVLQSVEKVVPPTLLNVHRTDVLEMKNVSNELAAAAAVNSCEADTMDVDKENIQGECCVQCPNVTDDSVAFQTQSNLVMLNEVHLTNRNVNVVNTSGHCDPTSMKQCHFPVRRETFCLASQVLARSTVQSDSLDVISLIDEVADLYQRSSELLVGNSENISTQEIEAHVSRFDGLKQHDIEGIFVGGMYVPLAQCAAISQSTCDVAVHEEFLPSVTVDGGMCSQSPVAVFKPYHKKSNISAAASDDVCDTQHLYDEVFSNEVDDMDESGEYSCSLLSFYTSVVIFKAAVGVAG